MVLTDKYRKILSAAVITVLGLLPVTVIGSQAYSYQVITDPTEIMAKYTTNGWQYSFADSFSIQVKGAPELPMKIIRLALPQNTKAASVSAVGTHLETLSENTEVAWFAGDIRTSLTEEYSPAPKNVKLYNTSSFYPGKYVEIINRGKMGGQPLVCLAVYPLQYNPANKRVVLVGDINIKINLQDDYTPGIDRAPTGSSLLAGLVNNPRELSRPISGGSHNNDGYLPGESPLGLGSGYVIITSAELAPAFYPYFVWKNQKGLSASLVLIEDILRTYSGEDDAAKLRAYLQEAYNQGAEWVLLGGDEDIIPIRYAFAGNTSTMPELKNQQICDL